MAFILNLNKVRKNLSTNMVLQDYDVTEISDYEIFYLFFTIFLHQFPRKRIRPAGESIAQKCTIRNNI